MARPDVLLVSLGSTAGLRAADAALVGSLERAGAQVVVATAARQDDVRTLALTDLVWARAARAAARDALAQHDPESLVYSTTTAALLWPQPGVIRFDAPAAATRPGRHGVWQRRVERRRLQQAPLLVPMDPEGLREAGDLATPSLVVPIPVAPSGDPGERDVAALTYATNPHKKGLDRIRAAWGIARRDDEELLVAGVAAGEPAAVADPGVRYAGRLAPDAYRALVRRARVYVTAPRREDYGIAQLEALADGCRVVTTAAPGPYAALPLVRALDPALVADHDPASLAAAIRHALDTPRGDWARRAARALQPFTPEAVDRVVAEHLLPALHSVARRAVEHRA